MPKSSNQLSRYGAISKSYPFVIGKVFILIASTEYSDATIPFWFPVDDDGVARVYTSWATVITAIQAHTDYSCILVSPGFTTAPTLAQVAALDAAGVTVYQAGLIQPDGSYITSKAAASLAQTTQNLFQVNGKIQLLGILGEVVTTISQGAATTTGQFNLVPTVGATQHLCQTTVISGMVPGDLLTITGSTAQALVVTLMGTTGNQVQYQQTPIILTAGNIQLSTILTSLGNVKWRVQYRPIDPGAFVYPL